MPKYAGVKCDQCGREHPRCRCRPIQPTWAGFPLQLQRSWQANYESKRAPRRYPRDTVRYVLGLIRDGYEQSSRKFLCVSLPDRSHSIDLSIPAFACFRRAARLIRWHKNRPFVLAYEAKQAASDARRAARKALRIHD